MDALNSVDILPCYLLDHDMVVAEFSLVSSVRGRGFWKLNTSILTNPKYVDQVNKIIENFNNEEEDVDPSIAWEELKEDVQN